MKKPSLFELFTLFLKMGTVAFGGGPAIISVMQQEVVEKRKWMETDEYLRGIGISFLPPGAIITNLAYFVGYSLRGFAGGVTAMLAMLIPSFLMMIVLGILAVKYSAVSMKPGIVRGIAPAVMGVIVALVVRMSTEQMKAKWGYLIIPVVFALIYFFKVNPVFMILGALIIAIICRCLMKEGGGDAS
ncbi:MAG: chromate transporter [Firmicutes bacterium]|nr:chromate transporter [Bacillota bacterium]